MPCVLWRAILLGAHCRIRPVSFPSTCDSNGLTGCLLTHDWAPLRFVQVSKDAVRQSRCRRCSLTVGRDVLHGCLPLRLAHDASSHLSGLVRTSVNPCQNRAANRDAAGTWSSLEKCSHAHTSRQPYKYPSSSKGRQTHRENRTAKSTHSLWRAKPTDWTWRQRPSKPACAEYQNRPTISTPMSIIPQNRHGRRGAPSLLPPPISTTPH